MSSFYIFPILIYAVQSETNNLEKRKFCNSLICDEWPSIQVCGIREEFEGFRLKLFENECQLLKYGCRVDEDKTYGIINLEYCENAFIEDPYHNVDLGKESLEEQNEEKSDKCKEPNCMFPNNIESKICGIKKHEAGYKVRIFENKCELTKHNCEKNESFVEIDIFICDSILSKNSTTLDDYGVNSNEMPKDTKLNNIIVIDSNILGNKDDINDKIETFFAATHVLDIPMREVSPDLVSEITRRRQIKIAGPIKVFQPWTTIPSNISDDYLHSPTLSSCFHKCPTKCPDTYAPVCGVPGIVAREPSLMFQNHCFMDVAQCKMRWEDKSPTAISSSYIESSFMFCLGDQLNAMYRFLPLVRTLQHMGRLKKKGRFRHKLRNMRFFNGLLSRDPKLMG